MIVFLRNQSIMKHGIPKGSGEDSPSFFIVKSQNFMEVLYMNKKTLKDIDVKGKRVFCRVDFNVPMQEGKITDETRIRAALPTIHYLMEQGAKVILASHYGRPKGKVVEEMRLTPVGVRLSELLGQD